MQTEILNVDDYEFETDTGEIYGELSYNLTVENCLDADIGGSDGLEGSAEIIGLKIGSQLLTRTMLVAMSSEASVAFHETGLSAPQTLLEAA